MNPWGFVCRVYDRHGVGHVRTLGSTDPAQTKELKAFARWLKTKRKWDALDLIIARACTIADAYDAHQDGELAAFVERIQTTQQDVDLSPFVTEWNGQGRRSRSDKYLTQVRRLIPEGKPFPASQFVKGWVQGRLDALPVDRATKNRYRAALLQFGRWLTKRGILEHNPVRDTDGYGENDPRASYWMPWKDAEKVCDNGGSAQYVALFALMYGSGAEIGAALATLAGDVVPAEETARIRGTKKYWRDRVAHVEPWAMQRIRPALKGLHPDAPIFQGINYDDAYKAHQDALERSKLGSRGFTPHDARHTYAVNALRKGYDEQVVAHQLGHKDASLVRTTYGRYVPDKSDYQTRNASVGARKSQRGR